VSPALLALAVAVVVAAVVAVSARDGRVAAIGLVAALALAPLVADPLPHPAAVAARIAAAALAGYLLRVALRQAPYTRGSRLGWAAEAVAAAAAFVAGIGAHGFAAGGDGPAAAVAAGFAFIALALVPLLDVRDMVRTGLGLLLLVAGADLMLAGYAGTPDALRELVIAAVVVAIGVAVAVLVADAARTPGGHDGTGHGLGGRPS
jgi:hypothetical protein